MKHLLLATASLISCGACTAPHAALPPQKCAPCPSDPEQATDRAAQRQEVSPSTPIDAPAADQAMEPIRVARFDCTSTMETKEGEWLTKRHGGGPYGATWNWYGAPLRCEVELSGSCEGKSRVRLMVGKQLAHDDWVPRPSSSSVVSIEIPANVWEPQLEEDGELIYETLELRVRVDSRCQLEHDVLLSEAVDSLVGRFAGGE